MVSQMVKTPYHHLNRKSYLSSTGSLHTLGIHPTYKRSTNSPWSYTSRSAIK